MAKADVRGDSDPAAAEGNGAFTVGEALCARCGETALQHDREGDGSYCAVAAKE